MAPVRPSSLCRVRTGRKENGCGMENVAPGAKKSKSVNRKKSKWQKFSALSPELQNNLTGGNKKKPQGVFVQAWVVRALRGETAAALLLCQEMYWSLRNKEHPGGTFRLSRAGAHEQIGI